jgi:predicted Ser/Thr protein kinase
VGLKLEDRVTGRIYPCALGDTLVVGRADQDPPPPIPVDDPRVSRQHCTLVVEAGGLLVTDMSSYGTYVNSHKVAGQVLAKPGDLIQLGAHYAFALLSDEAPSGPQGLPDRFGDRYRVVRELAAGGMGVVYEGIDEQTQRPCAIKVLKGSKIKPETVARFRREAAVGGKLAGHPGIVPVLDAGALSNGEPFYVMEFVDGDSFTQRINDGLPQREAVRLVAEVARAVAFAHERGVIHRDLKPQNIIVAPDGRARLTDFGVAKSLDAQDDLTATGAVMGTVTYMSPEQVEDSKRVDERTDVYGLGAVLYAALTRRPPIDLDGISMRDALERVLAHDITSPREILGPSQVDPTLNAVCMRAIEREPARRFASAADFAASLEAWLEGKVAHVVPPAPVPGDDDDDDEGAGMLVLFALIGVGLLAFAGLAAFALLR